MRLCLLPLPLAASLPLCLGTTSGGGGGPPAADRALAAGAKTGRKKAATDDRPVFLRVAPPPPVAFGLAADAGGAPARGGGRSGFRRATATATVRAPSRPPGEEPRPVVLNDRRVCVRGGATSVADEAFDGRPDDNPAPAIERSEFDQGPAAGPEGDFRGPAGEDRADGGAFERAGSTCEQSESEPRGIGGAAAGTGRVFRGPSAGTNGPANVDAVGESDDRGPANDVLGPAAAEDSDDDSIGRGEEDEFADEAPSESRGATPRPSRAEPKPPGGRAGAAGPRPVPRGISGEDRPGGAADESAEGANEGGGGGRSGRAVNGKGERQHQRQLSDEEVWVDHSIATAMPPAANLGIHIDSLDEANGSLSLAMPLEGNTNVHGTAFAGSLYSVAGLSAWYTLVCYLRSRHLHDVYSVVMKSAKIEYRRPVRSSTVVARSVLPGSDVCEDFLARLETEGKAYLDISGAIMQGEKRAVEYTAHLCSFRADETT